MSAFPAVYVEHLAAAVAGDRDALRRVWADDGVIEFPYAASIGTPTRLDGSKAITDYFDGLAVFGDFSFGERHAWQLGERHWLVEMHASSTIRSTGIPYEQDYVVRFTVGLDGRLTWMREYWDPTRL
ncbi:nuclear transport factor 2 family protein [Rhodococcoides kroppenstedtii]|uniref:nuclear transport factor 2 family protein n=1 Tax=Rhodococcoides kroppenstedtii TaxID=293050 RepID=UPI001427B208|nr:nuclear transport factor 2 family protein [Rhodococcus kroppenstedtii]NIL82230.1 protein YesE [Rhodococcus kroppenstedtii]